MTTPGEFDTRHLPEPGTKMSKATNPPKSFSRPAITLSSAASEKRDWRWRSASDIVEGDVVADVGLIYDISLVAGSYFVSTPTGSKVLPARVKAFVVVSRDD